MESGERMRERQKAVTKSTLAIVNHYTNISCFDVDNVSTTWIPGEKESHSFDMSIPAR